MRKISIVVVGFLFGLTATLPVFASAFQSGDVFLAIGNGQVRNGRLPESWFKH